MTVGGEITIKAGTVPGSPSAGNVTLWADSNNVLNSVDSDGNIFNASNGWLPANETWVYDGADDPSYTFTISSFDATTKYEPGMKVKLTNGGSVKYFFITKVVFDDPGSTITLYGGTDYDLANSAITLPYYSGWKAPFGFPLDPDKWTVEVTDDAQRTQSSPSAGIWYNLGTTNSQISVPIGAWYLYYMVTQNPYSASSDKVNQKTTLSTANNSQSHRRLTSSFFLLSGTESNVKLLGSTVTKEMFLVLNSKTLFYLNAMCTEAVSNITFENSSADLMVLRARCAYI